ncbi:MAG TPA: heavy metal-binding domain-containing protein [Tepidisphaeraceae bacterium]|nr:heavy metal-binding domain-containing protein [Tepidisphaeraceae bacterium]
MWHGSRKVLLIVPALCACLVALIAAPATFAHDAPAQLPDPQSVPEAWNVLEGCVANVDTLLDSNLLRDIGFQLANTSGPLRLLSAKADENPQSARVRAHVEQLLAMDGQVLIATRATTDPLAQSRQQWKLYRKTFAELEALYPADTVHSAVYICPMHPRDIHLNADDRCSVCGMSLIRRHLPASQVFERPGEASMTLNVISEPLVVGQRADVRIRIADRDGSAVTLDQLLEMHTRKIHLLINDASLSDYHHEHPTPTTVAGEYAFSFTPTKPGPYRIWADVVPTATSVQEYLIADVPANTASLPLVDRRSVSSVVVNGRTYQLNFGPEPIHARQTVVGTITVTGADGQGFTKLEPIMGAFAHIVGFSEDHRTVLHIHPYARDPLGPDDRAGPAFAFKFYAPEPGFYRLYGQVQIDRTSEFAPFGVNVLPAEAPDPK